MNVVVVVDVVEVLSLSESELLESRDSIIGVSLGGGGLFRLPDLPVLALEVLVVVVVVVVLDKGGIETGAAATGAAATVPVEFKSDVIELALTLEPVVWLVVLVVVVLLVLEVVLLEVGLTPGALGVIPELVPELFPRAGRSVDSCSVEVLLVLCGNKVVVPEVVAATRGGVPEVLVVEVVF